MKMKAIIDIIKELNGGCVIENVNDDISEHSLGTEECRLFVDNKKYYYFSNYIIIDEDFDNMLDIENYTINNMQAYYNIKKPVPHSSYLTLFYEVPEINDEVYKKVISLEENEFLFKKYVFYYTKEEYNSFVKWYAHQKLSGNIKIDDILNIANLSEQIHNTEIQFLLRLFIKIPFVKLNFKQAVLSDFGILLNQQLDGMRQNKNEIIELNNKLNSMISANETDEEIVERLFNEVIGGELDEI